MLLEIEEIEKKKRCPDCSRRLPPLGLKPMQIKIMNGLDQKRRDELEEEWVKEGSDDVELVDVEAECGCIHE